MMLSALQELIEIQADLAELRRLAQDLPPHIAYLVLRIADQMEARARAIDRMA